MNPNEHELQYPWADAPALGTLLTLRRPTVLAGIGVSNASIIGERKLRRVAT